MPLLELLLLALLLLAPQFAAAEGFAPPVPAAQTTEAELWFAIASVAMILALAAVQWLVSRR
ncbi:protein NnrT [Rubellimicrobium aerolatum]|uniref:Protein NnrT n=1 Tax=Rubellimicrobium aerolatum TaxID=490979 RepID=A0ABW0SGG6_9RHOB|nr:protein NnrT [Rubellimicrobium aerolatum]MBP1807401.1 hypothetical protein [Rubellimicrobium aerolatum]